MKSRLLWFLLETQGLITKIVLDAATKDSIQPIFNIAAPIKTIIKTVNHNTGKVVQIKYKIS